MRLCRFMWARGEHEARPTKVLGASLRNVPRLSGGEAPVACGASGTPLAATNEIVGGRDLQAA